MMYTLSYQTYRHEQGLSAAEQRTADISAGEAAAALRDLRLRLGRTFRLSRLSRMRHAGGSADAMPAPARILSSVR